MTEEIRLDRPIANLAKEAVKNGEVGSAYINPEALPPLEFLDANVTYLVGDSSRSTYRTYLFSAGSALRLLKNWQEQGLDIPGHEWFDLNNPEKTLDRLVSGTTNVKLGSEARGTWDGPEVSKKGHTIPTYLEALRVYFDGLISRSKSPLVGHLCQRLAVGMIEENLDKLAIAENSTLRIRREEFGRFDKVPATHVNARAFEYLGCPPDYTPVKKPGRY